MQLEKRVETINEDCIHFGGYKPCRYNKQDETLHCHTCTNYQKVGEKILILKLGAAGEVLRNTPLLRRLKKEYPNSRVFWLTEYPELVPKNDIFRVYDFNQREVELIKDVEFDILYSLDKHEEIGALANRIKSKIKKGFSQKDGVIVPFDKDTEHKWVTGVFNDEMKKNKKHYIEEIFEICGFDFREEKYMLPDYTVPGVELDRTKKIVAVSTGASLAWRPRIYSKENYTNLTNKLFDGGYEVMLIGGPLEDKRNREISEKTGAKYFGVLPYSEVIGLLSLADVVVTPVTFALHAAVGLEKRVVLLNNVFNKNEFYLYNRGVILEPPVPCLMCYKNDFDEKCHTKNCLDLIKPEKIVEEVNGQIKLLVT
jgi:ADP-heptose:LPS heptosyltransferase